MANRKAATEYLLEFMKTITKDGRNEKIYSSLFEKMSDADFNKFVRSLEDGGELTIFTSVVEEEGLLNYDHMLKLGEKYGLPIKTQLIMVDEDTGLEYLTPETYIVGTTDVRKQIQMQIKKMGVAKDDTRIDDLTGQVFGDSRGAGFSLTEARVLENLGLSAIVLENYDVKGGDLGALNAYRSSIQETGKVSLRESLNKGSGVKSLKTAQYLLMGRHIDNNVGER